MKQPMIVAAGKQRFLKVYLVLFVFEQQLAQTLQPKLSTKMKFMRLKFNRTTPKARLPAFHLQFNEPTNVLRSIIQISSQPW